MSSDQAGAQEPRSQPSSAEAPAARTRAARGGIRAHGRAVGVVQQLRRRLRQREAELAQLLRITERISYGVALPDVLEFIYRELRQVIPCDRMGVSLIDEARGEAVAHWARSDQPMLLGQGYRASLGGSSLQRVLETGRPRIINDLEAYLRQKPDSESTRLVVEEGMRSSLTCPLIVGGKAVGFMFFSSMRAEHYRRAHATFFRQIAGLLAALVEKGRLYTELAGQKAVIERQNEATRQDLETARTVQLALVPRPPQVDGLQFAFAYEPAIQIGGDVLDALVLGPRRVLLFVGDAVGHGVQAALIMSVVKTALQTAVKADPAPSAVLASVSEVLGGFFEDLFVTAVCCLVETAAPGGASAGQPDLPAGRVELALAGHVPPLWFRAADGQVTPLGWTALPLGVAQPDQFHSVTVELAEGDALVLYTDGLTEAVDDLRRPYGRQRLQELLARQGRDSAQGVLSAITADLAGHRGHRPIDDDCSLVVVKMDSRLALEVGGR